MAVVAAVEVTARLVTTWSWRAGELRLSTLAVSVRLLPLLSVQFAEAFRAVSVAVMACVPSNSVVLPSVVTSAVVDPALTEPMAAPSA